MSCKVYRAGTELVAGALATSLLSRMTLNGAVVVQEGMPIRADEIVPRARGLLRVEIELEVWKLHDTIGDAFTFRATEPQNRTGRASLQASLLSGSTWHTLYWAAPVWRAVEVQCTGVSTLARYSIIAGRVADSTSSEASPPILTGLTTEDGLNLETEGGEPLVAESTT